MSTSPFGRLQRSAAVFLEGTQKLRKLSISALLAVASAFALAGTSYQLPFMPRKGVMEFTGEMIARPVQMNDLLAKGTPYHVALAIQSDARARLAPFVKEYEPRTDYYIIKLPRDTNEYLMNRDLMASGGFEYVEPNWRLFPAYVPNDSLFGQQYHHKAGLGTREGWDLFRGTNTLVVANCDTGVRHGHEDLASQLVPGYNAVQGKDEATYGSSITEDLNGHGTHTAGIAAAASDNGKGVASVGFKLKFMPIRVSDSSSGNSSLAVLNAGAMWAADHGARSVNTSYSGVNSQSVQTTGAYLKTKNSISCWAAGNDGSTNNNDWADVTITGSLAYSAYNTINTWSNRGTATDVMAPGENILSTYYSNNSSYGYLSGTSMASPATSSTMGAIMDSNPVITSQDAENIVYNTCVDLGAGGDDSIYGRGRVNLHDALVYAYNNFGFQPNSITKIKGNIAAGGLAQVLKSDNTYLEVTPSPADVPSSESMVIEYKFNTTLLMTNSMEIKVETSTGGANLLQKVRIWNNDTSSFDELSAGLINTTDNTLTLTIASGAFKYVGAGGLIRLRTVAGPTVGGLGVMRHKIDWVNIKTKP